MMQKIVMKVQLHCGKCRSKALSIAAKESGVVSVKIEGEKKDEVVVIGEGVDAARIASLIRKKVGHARLELVADFNDQD